MKRNGMIGLLLAFAMLMCCLQGCTAQSDTPVVDEAYEYMLQVEQKNAELIAAVASEDEIAPAGNGTHTEILIQPGSLLRGVAAVYLQPETSLSMWVPMDTTFMENIKLDIQLAQEDDLLWERVGLMLGDNPVLHVETLEDYENELSYVTVPELTDLYLMLDVGALLDTILPESGLIPEEPEQMIPEFLPEKMPEYVQALYAPLQNVEKTTEQMQIGELQQELTVVTVTATEPELRTCLESLLAAMGADAQQTEETVDPLLEELFSGVKKAEDRTLVLKTYVNDTDNVVGRSMLVAGQELFSWLLVVQDGQFRAGMQMAEYLLMGTGTVEEDLINGDFTLSVSEQEMLTVTIKDFDRTKNQNGDLQLDLEASLSQELTRQLAAQMPTDLFSDAVTLKLQISKQGGELSVKGNLLFDYVYSFLKVQYVEKPADYEITIPQNVIDGTDEKDQITWNDSLRYDVLWDNLRAAGVPESLIEQLMPAFQPAAG